MPQNYAVRSDDKRLGGNRSLSYGIRVKNPLPKPVRLEVIDGKTIVRRTVLKPDTAKFINVDKEGTYDIRAIILESVPGPGSTSEVELGLAGISVLGHEDVAVPEIEPVLREGTIVLNRGYWKSVVRWDIPKGISGELLEIQIEQLEGVEWRLKMGHWLDARDSHCTAKSMTQSLTFEQCFLGSGEAVIVQARAKGMKGINVAAKIIGRFSTTASPKAEPITKEKPPDDEPIRSLSDMFDDLRKEEATV